MVPSSPVPAPNITHMTMSEYKELRSKTLAEWAVRRRENEARTYHIRDYDFCRRMYIETGSIYWFDEMIQRVSPRETGG